MDTNTTSNENCCSVTAECVNIQPLVNKIATLMCSSFPNVHKINNCWFEAFSLGQSKKV